MLNFCDFIQVYEVADVQSDCRELWFILTPFTSRGSMLLMECKLHYVPMVYYRAFQ